MARRYEHADKYLERKRTAKIVGIVAVVIVGVTTAVLVVMAVMG
ncbi:hypothetical protein M2152_002066 [Microbacteriaceae bacterium SG_E_30_P1]|uniref:Uncharacterized protein n=1 Tax=Antiquaquibacter oligotrophicus TaxID=2880260 RepID=A0ABT6KRQ2_9MICO|nr:hypothetical protein [Antiquaquibacter oligotrophicus]